MCYFFGRIFCSKHCVLLQKTGSFALRRFSAHPFVALRANFGTACGRCYTPLRKKTTKMTKFEHCNFHDLAKLKIKIRTIL